MEEDVYLCGWSKSGHGIELWVKSRPHLRSRGRTYSEAEDALLEVIARVCGVHHAVFEFVPPLPKSTFDERYSRPELYTIWGDDRCETDEPRRTPFESEAQRAVRLSWYDTFFVAPCCRDCGMPLGPRSETQLRLTQLNSSYDGGFVTLAGAMLYVFSERFLGLLSNDERERLEFRLVDRPPKSRKKFFELIGPSGPPQVALVGREPRGWRCARCDARVFGYSNSPHVAVTNFIARSDLPDPLPQIFTIGTQPNIELCATAERWAGLVGKRGTRGLISRLLGVVPDAEVVRAPELEVRNDRR